MEVIKFLGTIGTTLMIVQYAKPITWIKAYFRLTLDSKTYDREIYRNILKSLLNCSLCTGFWVGLAFYQNFYWGVVIAFASELAWFGLGKLFKTL